jgi:hypothetical protein
LKSSDKYPVAIADAGGFSIHQMSRQDLIEMVSTNDNTWVFVDSQMVRVEEFETIELNEDTEIRINPGMIGGPTMRFNTLIFDSELLLPLSTQKSKDDVLVLLDDYWVFRNPGIVLNNQMVLDLCDRDRHERLYAVPKELVSELDNYILQGRNEYCLGSNHPGPVELSTFEVFILMAANPTNLSKNNKFLFVGPAVIGAFGLLNLPLEEENIRRLQPRLTGGGPPVVCILKVKSRAPIYITVYDQGCAGYVETAFAEMVGMPLTEHEINQLKRTICSYITIDNSYKELENDNLGADIFRADIYLSTQINESLLVEYARPAPDS